jgi:hypothetical protein
MFKRFYQAEAQKRSAESAVVRDRYTDKVIFQGTREECAAYVGAFDLCYLEAV